MVQFIKKVKMKITVLNNCGTLTKRYNPIKGNLVPTDNIALDKIVKSCHNVEFDIKHCFKR